MVLTKFKRNSKEKIKSTHNGRFCGKNKRANRTRNEFEYKDKECTYLRMISRFLDY